MRPPTPRKSPLVSDLSPDDVPAVRLRGRRVSIRKLGSCSQRPTSLHDARGAASPDELGSALRGVPQTYSHAAAKVLLAAEAPAIMRRGVLLRDAVMRLAAATAAARRAGEAGRQAGRPGQIRGRRPPLSPSTPIITHFLHAVHTRPRGSAHLLPPQMRTVWSSLAEANMCGSLGFHATALTVPEWPGSTSSSRALWRCHVHLRVLGARDDERLVLRRRRPSGSQLRLPLAAACVRRRRGTGELRGTPTPPHPEVRCGGRARTAGPVGGRGGPARGSHSRPRAPPRSRGRGGRPRGRAR